MRMTLLIILFTITKGASAQIPKEIYKDIFLPDKVIRDKYEPYIRPKIYDQEIPVLQQPYYPLPVGTSTEPYIAEIMDQISKCKYEKEKVLLILKALEDKCTKLETKSTCIISARKKFLQTLIDNCNKK